jgi:acetyl-CoA synthetase
MATTLLEEALDNNVAEIMDAEDPLFILYTSGSTGKPRNAYHSRLYGLYRIYI